MSDPRIVLPDAEATQCKTGYCMETGVAGQGYCSGLCDPASDTCAADSGNPTMQCLSLETQPRQGVYADNAGAINLCRENVDCTPCFSSGYCPGDRVCTNLGQAEGPLADYRCVPSCTTDADCAGETASTCSEGTDGYGNAVNGCFVDGTNFPENYCAQ